jgi:hypothetical protein
MLVIVGARLRISIFAIAVIILVLLSGCSKPAPKEYVVSEIINGAVQKGPFIAGTSITYFALDDAFVQTGRAFSTQIQNYLGIFQIPSGISLNSQYLLLSANGFYFNEVKGGMSESSINLFAVSDVSDRATVNINLLTSLAKERILYLVGKKMPFSQAVEQAKTEVLNVFHLTKADIADFQSLDITQGGDDNAILLAISVIMQGNNSAGELSSLLFEISSDIREDGRLNNGVLGSQLINSALAVNLPQIRSNLEKQFQSLGVPANVSDFEKYVGLFILNNTGANAYIATPTPTPSPTPSPSPTPTPTPTPTPVPSPTPSPSPTPVPVDKNRYFRFTLVDGTYSLLAINYFDDLPEVLQVPSSYKGVPVTRIEGSLLANLPIKVFVIPSTVVAVGNNLCGLGSNCPTLEAIVCLGEQPFTLGSFALNDAQIKGSLKIFVPDSSVELYKAKDFYMRQPAGTLPAYSHLVFPMSQLSEKYAKLIQ